MLKSLRLSHQLLLGIAILSVFSLGVAFFVVNTLVREVVHENILESNLRYRQVHAQQLDAWFAEQAQIVEVYSRILHLVDSSYYLQLLDEIVYNYELAQSFWINLYDGSMFDSNRWIPPDWWVAQERPWWQLAEAHSGEVTITLPYVSAETHRLVSTISRHIFDWGGQPGVAAMDIDLWRFEAIMKDFAALTAGYLFLVGPRREIIIHPNQEYMLGDYGFTNVADIDKYQHITEDFSAVLELNDTYFMQFPLYSIGWTLVAVIPNYVTSTPVWNIILIVMMVIIFAVAIVSIFTFFYVKWVAALSAKRENELLQTMLDSSPSVIVVLDWDSVVVDTNHAALRLYEFKTKQEYITGFAKTVPEFQPNGVESLPYMINFFRGVIESGEPTVFYNWIMQTSSGEPRPIDVTAVPIKIDGKDCVIIHTVDLRERYKLKELQEIEWKREQEGKVREAEREAEERTRVLLDSSPTAGFVLDGNRCATGCNQAAIELFVKKPGETLAETYPEVAAFSECVPNCHGCKNYGQSSCHARQYLILNNRKVFPGYETNTDAIEQMLKEGTAVALETGKRQISEFEYLTLYGEVIPVEITVVALRYRSGYGLAIYVRDLREMHLIQAEIIRREIAENESLAKSQFLARMSHEIRTPMNAILGMSELVLRENIAPQVREQAEIIKQSGNHLLSIINDILDLSKIESGKLELVEAEYLTASVINDIVNIIKVRIAGRKLRFILNISSSIPHGLWGDPVRLYQIIMNLLGNAVKYTETGFVALDMTAARNGDTAQLSIKVRDSGRGIKKQDLPKLFDEFVRLDTDANAGIEGTGLGLAITRSLIQHMGGSIEVESTYGEGSTFTVILSQAIKDHENMAAVISPEEKPVIIFERRKHCVESISYTMEDLGVPFQIVDTVSQFHEGLESGNYAFAFASEKLYDDFCAEHPDVQTQTKIVLVSQADDGTAPKDRGLPVLQTPIYCLAVAPLLNNKMSDHSYVNKNLKHFVAPDAKVLIVDDVQVNLKVADGLLKPYQMTSTLCESGQEAIEAIKTEAFDLVLMDYMMPVMSGVEAVEKIRQLEVGKKLPVIALTANAIVGAREMFLQTGFDDFISKPIEVAQLNDILAKWIPKEKQRHVDPSSEETQADSLDIHIDGIDTAKGLALSGENTALYLDLIATFGTECPKKLEELKRCYEAQDIPLYTIHVHALKSACANIGADALSKEAENLENAGDRRYVEFIRKHHDRFVNNLTRLISDIKTMLANTEKPSDTAFDDNTLFSGLNELKAALEKFDVSTIDKISDNLQDFTRHPTYGEAISEILQLTFVSKYKQADALLGTILENLEGLT